MSTKKNNDTLLRIASNGFIPFEIPEAYKVTTKGENHPNLEGKSHEDLYNMIHSNDILICFSNSQQEIGKMYIKPELRMGNNVISFYNEEVFFEKPLVETQVENKILKIKMELKIDLTKMIQPSQFKAFIKMFTCDGFTHIGWSYNCTLKEGGQRTDRRMTMQSASDYSFNLLEK